MTYKHILVAVDLTDESIVLIDKAVGLAKALQAEVSFIHIDVNYAELYTGLIDINLPEVQHQTAELSKKKLQDFADHAAFPIKHTLVGSGDLSSELSDAINERGMDLVVCGHHQDFWSKLLSSTRQLINTTPVDMLVVPLHD